MKTKLRIEFTTLFEKQRKEASEEIKKAFIETLTLFLENEKHPALRNHALKEKLNGYKSIDITSDVRAIFKEKYSQNQRIIIFHMIGTHKQLYK